MAINFKIHAYMHTYMLTPVYMVLHCTTYIAYIKINERKGEQILTTARIMKMKNNMSLGNITFLLS